MCESDAYERAREQRYAALGTRTPRCRPCGEDNPFALTGVHPAIECYECQATAAGRSRAEQHVQGKANGPETVPMLGNEHRVADARKVDWPEETLRNPDGSPLLRAAAHLRGWLDLLHTAIDVVGGWVPALLERLDAMLRDLHGRLWWTQPGFEGLT